jgi:general secretion pathway protein E
MRPLWTSVFGGGSSAAAPRAKAAGAIVRDRKVDRVRATPARSSVNNNDELVNAAAAGKYGDLLTAPGGRLEVSDKFRQVAAIFEYGVCLVAEGYHQASYFTSAAEFAKRMGVNVSPATIVGIDDLRRVYAAASRTGHAAAAISSEISSEMQRDILRRIEEAVKLRASDLHIHVTHKETEVEYRIDGMLVKQPSWPIDYGKKFQSATHAMADTGASDANYNEREYQGARISVAESSLPEGVQACRLQFNPTINGGRILIIRLLYTNTKASGAGESLEALGYHPDHIEGISRIMRMPKGINMWAGPVNSGKTTSLATILGQYSAIYRGQKRILTVEDPPELMIPTAVQMPVANANTPQERADAFQAAIRAALRSDPNVLLIGEIRDKESGQLAMEGVLTGHGIYATIHATSAHGIIDRLRNMGVEEWKITNPEYISSLFAQHLVRKLCPDCKVPMTKANTDPHLYRRLRALKADTSYVCVHGRGCSRCAERGFVGRTIAAEMILPDFEYMKLLRESNGREAERYWLQELHGFTMVENGVSKVLAGILDPNDVETLVGYIDPEVVRVADQLREIA